MHQRADRGTDIVTSFWMDIAGFHPGLPDHSAQPLMPGCAVAVCTYSRSQALERFLESLEGQSRQPDELVIVDASRDDGTEIAIKKCARRERLAKVAGCLKYVRVAGARRGLTRQRNLALRIASRDLIAFFDDDVILLPGCIQELEQVHRTLGSQVMGAAAAINDAYRPSALWRARRALRIVPSLEPGTYTGSGMSIPWGFLPRPHGPIAGDWLPGTSTMWRTAAARELGFCEEFDGYAQGEDLEFSLRARHQGRLVMTSAARVLHVEASVGRPNHYRLGYMAIRNRYYIHRRGIQNRAWRHGAWFVYAWTLDTLLMTRQLLFPTRIVPTVEEMLGRLKAVFDLIATRRLH